MIWPRFLKQIRSAHYPTALGQVTSSEVKSASRARGKRSYRAAISYAYTVGEQEWTSDRVSNAAVRFGDGSRQAEAFAAQFPVGKEVTVFYNPDAPAEATLRPGLLPEHLIVALFLVPFHLIALGLLLFAFKPLAPRLGTTATATPLRPLGDLRMAIRMPWLAPWVVGLFALGGASIVAVMVGGFALALPTPMAAAVGVWVVVLVFAALIVQWRRGQIAAGLADLIIDASARTVTLPVDRRRKQRLTLPFDEVHGVSVRRLPAQTTRTTKHGWTVTKKSGSSPFEIALIGPSEQPFPLATSSSEEMLRGMAEALSSTFGWSLKYGFGVKPPPTGT